MIIKNLEKYIIPLVAVIGFTALSFWFLYDPVQHLSVSQPGMDNRPDKEDLSNEIVEIGENFNEYTLIPSILTGKWPRFRGADFDNINKEKIGLISKFGSEGPKIKWKIDLGEGHAAPAIYNGKVYLLDYMEEKKIDALRCFSLETGEEIWRRSYSVHVKRNHGMSRTVPAVNQNYIVTIGPRGHVMCVNRETGDFLWGIDLEKEYKTEIPFWYTGQCPLISDDVAIIAPGGTVLVIGVNCSDGKVVWETLNQGNWKMSHSSIMPMNFEGKKMLVYAAVGGICGISAEGNNAGEILWKTNEFAPSVVAPSPVILNDGKIFITAGYSSGAMLFKLIAKGEKLNVKIIQKYKPNEGIASEQQTPILYEGKMFSILPKDAGPLRNQFVCVDPNDCQTILWSSGKTERFGLGPYIIADKKFFILSDNGTLTIAEASISGFKVLDKYRVIQGQDAWGPIAIADGYLLMRDSKQMVCLNLKAKL